jgi:transposase
VYDGTTVLFGVEDEFTVLHVERLSPEQVRVVMEVTSGEDGCPACGVVSWLFTGECGVIWSGRLR